MRRATIPAIAAAAVLVLTGCSGGSNDESDSAADGAGNESSESTAAGQHTDKGSPTSTESDDTDGDDADSDDADSDDADDDADTELTLTVGGDDTTIEPTDVYCSGSEGNIHHIIGKTNDGLPLVKAEDTHFAMVKTGHQRPYKAESPSGIDYGKDRVTFDDTSLGSATLNGTMTCTEWED